MEKFLRCSILNDTIDDDPKVILGRPFVSNVRTEETLLLDLVYPAIKTSDLATHKT